jgi:hypothetical protein
MSQALERMDEDARIRLGDTHLFRNHNGVEERIETGSGEPWPLHLGQSVGDERQAIAAGQRRDTSLASASRNDASARCPDRYR